jgi:hypothetical protein
MFQGFKLWLAKLFRSAANKLDPLPKMVRPMSRGGQGEER